MSKYTKTQVAHILARIEQDARPCDPKVIIQQMGVPTFFAVCGGKWTAVVNKDNETVGVLMPTSGSRMVEVILDWMDTYTVRRTRIVTHGDKRGDIVVESETQMVYCDQLNEVVWQASCWR